MTDTLQEQLTKMRTNIDTPLEKAVDALSTENLNQDLDKKLDEPDGATFDQSTEAEDHPVANPEDTPFLPVVDASIKSGRAIDLLKPKEEAVARFYYRRNDIRNWMCGPFHFKDHMLQIDGTQMNDLFLQTLRNLPEYDQNNILVFDPEAFAKVTSKVSQPVRGIQTSENINEARMIQNPSPSNSKMLFPM